MKRNSTLKLKAAKNYSRIELHLLTCFPTRTLRFFYIWTHDLRRQGVFYVSNDQLNIFLQKICSLNFTFDFFFGHNGKNFCSKLSKSIEFLLYAALCCFGLISCSRTWEMSPPPRTSITVEIIRFALDLCPARCRRFLVSSSAITQHNFTHNWYVASAFIQLTMDHVDEFELNCI